jgi:predicted S18 family serine protease
MSDKESGDARKTPGRTLLFLSVLVNLLLISVSGFLFYQNFQLSDQVSELSSSVSELTGSTMALEQQLNVSQSQLEYYRGIALYYSNMEPSGGGGAYVLGTSSIPIVALQTIQSGFQVEYQGVVMAVDIELVDGSGRILVDTVPRIGIDIQTSVRTAVVVAEEITGVSLSETDVILTVSSEEEIDVVDGQSAGAATTIALISAMTNVSVNQGVYMTGTINADTSVGAVGGVPYKALAAAERGSNLFIVPDGQSTVVIYRPVTYKTFRGRVITTYEKETMELEDYLSEKGYYVQVLEVKDINDAYEIFFGLPISVQ